MTRLYTYALLSAFIQSCMLVGGRKTRLWTPLEDTVGGSIDSVSNSKASMLEDGYVLISSEVSNGVTFDIWGLNDINLGKRSLSDFSTPEKRDNIDIQGRKCDTACAFQTNVPKANLNDCQPAYQELYNKVGIFTLPPTRALSATSNTCSVWVVNHSTYNITYDYWDAAGTGQWLNYDCLMQQGATVGVCQYEGIGSNTTNGVWTAICAPSFMTG